MHKIETERLLIRRFTIEDAQDLYEYLSDESVVKYEPYGVYTKEQAIEEAKIRSNNESFYAVCLKENNKLVGNLYLSKGDFDEYELGYVFNRKYHGYGYATEAALALINYTFTTLGARRIISMCNPLNKPSWKLLERLSMRREGHLVKNIYFKKDDNNEPLWSDTYVYAILKDEWNKLFLPKSE